MEPNHAAVREAAISTVAHANYATRGAQIRISIFDNRLKINNLGLLPFGLTVGVLEKGVSKLRNGLIRRAFHAPVLSNRRAAEYSELPPRAATPAWQTRGS